MRWTPRIVRRIFSSAGAGGTPTGAPELFPAPVGGISAGQDLSPVLGEARRSPGLRRGNLANLPRPSRSAGGSSGSALNRARKEGHVRSDLREAMGIRAGTEQSLRRIRISAGAQAPEEAVGAMIATVRMIQATGRPIGAGRVAGSAGDLGAVQAAGDGETRRSEVAAQVGRHRHPRRLEAEAASEPVGHQWMDLGGLPKG